MPALATGADYIKGLGSMSLEIVYQSFLRLYFTNSTRLPISPAGISIFNSDGGDDISERYKENGYICTIATKDEFKFGEGHEHDFKIRDLGAATWLFRIKDASKILDKQTCIKVEVPDVCDDLFIVAFRGQACLGVTKFDKILHNEEKKIKTLTASLKSLASFDLTAYVGIVACVSESENGDEPEIHDVKMKVDFFSSIILPPITAYTQYSPGKDLMRATADLTIESVSEGVLGPYKVTNAVYPQGVVAGGEKLVTVQLEAPFPQSIRLHSSPIVQECPEIRAGFNNDIILFKYVPTGNMSIEIYYVNAANQLIGDGTARRYQVPMSTFSTKDGYTLDVDIAQSGAVACNVALTAEYQDKVPGSSGTLVRQGTYTISFNPPAH